MFDLNPQVSNSDAEYLNPGWDIFERELEREIKGSKGVIHALYRTRASQKLFQLGKTTNVAMLGDLTSAELVYRSAQVNDTIFI